MNKSIMLFVTITKSILMLCSVDSKITLRLLVFVCTMLSCGSQYAFATSFFSGLGDLQGGIFLSQGFEVSPDGSVTMGQSGIEATDPGATEAFRWTQTMGITGLSHLPGGGNLSQAYNASQDGSLIIGYSDSSLGFEAFIWSQSQGLTRLGDLAGGTFESMAYGISADGSVVVGASQSVNGQEAFLWTQDGGMIGLGDLAGGLFRSNARAGVSADGTVVAGIASSTSGSEEAFRWTESGGMQGLGDLPGGNFFSVALDISADGTSIVGRSESALGVEAFRWTESGGMQGLGDLEGGIFQSDARAVSADGSVVVGYSSNDVGRSAFIWDENKGMRNLKIALENDFGLDLSGWTLISAEGISDDGNVIVGSGIDPNGLNQGWIASTAPDAATLVEIDIKPRNNKNKVNPNSNAAMQVAILTNGEFDALQLNPATIRFGPSKAKAILNRTKVMDIERDGDMDLVVVFRTRQTDIACGETEANLVGETFSDISIMGTDSIYTAGCN